MREKPPQAHAHTHTENRHCCVIQANGNGNVDLYEAGFSLEEARTHSKMHLESSTPMQCILKYKHTHAQALSPQHMAVVYRGVGVTENRTDLLTEYDRKISNAYERLYDVTLSGQHKKYTNTHVNKENLNVCTFTQARTHTHTHRQNNQTQKHLRTLIGYNACPPQAKMFKSQIHEQHTFTLHMHTTTHTHTHTP